MFKKKTPKIFKVKTPLGGTVIVWTSIRVFSLAFRDGLHRGSVQPAASAVPAAVGCRWDSRTTLSGGGGHCEGFRGEALCVGFGERAWDGLYTGRGLLQG